MRKVIFSIIVLAVLTGCITRKQCDERCESRIVPVSKTVRDSVAIRYRDSIRWVEAKKGPDTTLTLFGSSCNCDSLTKMMAAIQKNPIIKKKNGLTETIKSPDGKSLEFDCDADAYKDTLRNVKEERDFWHFEATQKEVKVTCDKEHRTRFDGFTFWWFWITAAIILIASAKYLFSFYQWVKRIMP